MVFCLLSCLFSGLMLLRIFVVSLDCEIEVFIRLASVSFFFQHFGILASF